MKPYISIVMPVYNNEKYFPNAVQSIMNQTFSDWELIIVDDGSTDRTPEIADRFANKDNRVKVIHQINQWIYNSFNNGIEKANGKYVFVVNSDDTLNIEALEEIHKISSKDDVDMVLFNLVINEYDEQKDIINYDLWHTRDLLKENFVIADTKKLRNEWPNFIKKKLLIHQCVYKTEIAKRNKYRTDIFGADYYYNIQIANEIKTVAGTNYVVYNHIWYRNNNMNASVDKYYGYEHSMYNEFYSDAKNLFDSWGLEEDVTSSISDLRIKHYTSELESLNAPTCHLTLEEKLEKILGEYLDDIVYGCAVRLDRLEELESRALSGCRSLLLKDIPKESSKYYFVYELLNSLLRYEKDEEDMLKIKNAVYNKNNPRNIGKSFFDKLKLREDEGNV